MTANEIQNLADGLPIAERISRPKFDSRWIVEPYSGCWLWIGGLNTDGYPLFYLGGRGDPTKIRGHRASWIIFKGSIPDGLLVCHKCDTPICVNPDHLFIGTQKDNNLDRSVKGRNVDRRGSKCPTAKLTDIEVLAIRADSRRQDVIALSYGVGQTQISRIKKRTRWTHI